MQPARETREYVRSYTRIASEAADLAPGTVLALELSRSRSFECLAHQITVGHGPLFDVWVPRGLSDLSDMVQRQMLEHALRPEIQAALREAEDDAEIAELRVALLASVDGWRDYMSDPKTSEFVSRLAQGSKTFCPDFV